MINIYKYDIQHRGNTSYQQPVLGHYSWSAQFPFPVWERVVEWGMLHPDAFLCLRNTKLQLEYEVYYNFFPMHCTFIKPTNADLWDNFGAAV